MRIFIAFLALLFPVIAQAGFVRPQVMKPSSCSAFHARYRSVQDSPDDPYNFMLTIDKTEAMASPAVYFKLNKRDNRNQTPVDTLAFQLNCAPGLSSCGLKPSAKNDKAYAPIMLLNKDFSKATLDQAVAPHAIIVSGIEKLFNPAPAQTLLFVFADCAK